MLSLNNVFKTVKVGKRKLDILKNISFEVNEGDMVVISGESGSGKSTLLNIIGGLDDISSGEYYFNNKKINSEDDRNKLRKTDISMIVQNFALIGDMSVIGNINLAKKDNNYSKELMDILGISKLKNKKVRNLSGGEKQRAAIARALIKKPKLLLCDEPTGALDSENTRILVDLLKELNRNGLTIIVVTHNMSIVNEIGIKYIMKDGELQKVSS